MDLVEIVHKLDLMILDKVERLAQKIQVWTGYDCMSQARFIGFIYLCATLGEQIVTTRSSFFSTLTFFLSFTLQSFVISILWDPIKTQTRRYSMSGLKNSRKIEANFIFFRLLQLMITIVHVTMHFYRKPKNPCFLSTELFTLFILLICTDPLPPGQSKLRQKLESLFLSPQTQKAES